jgi:disulfide bond formation protein DsbB
MSDLSSDPAAIRLAQLGIFAACAGALGTAYISQHVFGLEPCVLCSYQRAPYILAGALALLGLCLPTDGRRPIVLIAATTIIFLASAFLAFYHVGIEQYWWASVAACGGQLSAEISIEQLQAALSNKPLKACNEQVFQLLGISMAGYNSLASLILALATLIATWRLAGGLKASL